MKEIILAQGQKAFVDDDFKIDTPGRKYIAVRYPRGNCLLAAYTQWNHSDGRLYITYLDRKILGLTNADPRQVRHINGNSLDCQRANLQITEAT
jgi:hypothetical protein